MGMVNSKGKRSRTRNIFKKNKRKSEISLNSLILMKNQLNTNVSIKINPSIKKGIPNKWYMGKSGTVTNISNCFVQIFIKKMIKNKLLNKNILISTEHIRRKKSKNNYLLNSIQIGLKYKAKILLIKTACL